MIGAAALNLAIWLPIAGAVAIVLLPGDRARYARWVAAAVSAAVLVLALGLAVAFDRGTTGPNPSLDFAAGLDRGLTGPGPSPQFVTRLPWVPQFGISYFIGLDGLSLPMFVLNALLVFLAVLVSWNTTARAREYFALLLVLQTAVSGVFSSLDLFLFFLFWELELAPMFLLIGVWGSERREYAAMKFLLYTVAGSAFMLVGIFVLYFGAGPDRSFDLLYLGTQRYAPSLQALAWVLLFIGFAVKTPIFPLHTWLPDAHTEAPTAISVLLAGVLLKMGAYGLLRLNVGLLPEATQQFALALAILGVINVLYGALVAMMQTDLKRVIANSSVSHMGYVVLGASALTPMALEGAVFQMFSHGVITALLFVMVGLIYDRTHTRTIADLGGLAARMPIIATVFVVAGLASLGLPGMSGFVAEFLVLAGAFPRWGVGTIIGVFTIVVTAGYILWLLERVLFGPALPRWQHLGDATRLETATIGALVLATLLVGLFPWALAEVINSGVGPLLARYA